VHASRLSVSKPLIRQSGNGADLPH